MSEEMMFTVCNVPKFLEEQMNKMKDTPTDGMNEENLKGYDYAVETMLNLNTSKDCPSFIMLIGLSASGKSSIAKQLRNKGYIIHSSDKIREEILGDYTDQTQNNKVFTEMYRRTKNSLLNGQSVVYDATNLTIKDRKSILSVVRDIKCKKIALLVVKNFEQCILDNKDREYPVPEYVIKKQMYKFQIPFKEEGFDEVLITYGGNPFELYRHTEKDFCQDKRNELTAKMTMEQKTKYHKHSLIIHCLMTSITLFKGGKKDKLVEAGLLHDVGKLFTQTIDIDTGEAHYYGHANVGAYYLLCNPYLVMANNNKSFLDILFYINYHMNVFDWKTVKTHNKYKSIFGENKYNNLIYFNLADKFGSGYEGENMEFKDFLIMNLIKKHDVDKDEQNGNDENYLNILDDDYKNID